MTPPHKDEPVRLTEDADTGDRFLLYGTDSGIKVELRYAGETLWATQDQMAEMFGVNVPSISRHLKNIFAEGELLPGATVSKIKRVAREGTREVRRSIERRRAMRHAEAEAQIAELLKTEGKLPKSRRKKPTNDKD